MFEDNAVFDEIMELKSKFDKVMDKLSLTDADVSVISAEYAQLKAQVKMRLNDLQCTANATSDEKTYLLPALREVHHHCVARSNTQNRQDLSSSLNDAQDFLSHYLSQKH
ncbi:hypothetical protein [Vibrio panuliri]|uniref:Uncharacterized protein n=1 Tax=Vibrio panuliri TaxID=1381081 RepID=A0A1Q9HQN8_9VIBR|nr:hypothetical protein [Vibrio panuliri]KAB1458069.1 hypothetical protein F7O85_10170 [Vibrio panuliri]OLQ93188.1 hypothetical protein BIY22_01475 [Vibrio panuliri]OLQ95111.1 hypothetical protein BIY20_07130 [Vibrio panuliri]